MPRGGRRSGKPGQAYPNRADLRTAPDAGASTFKGQPYGAATQQAQAQVAAPAQSPPVPAAGPPTAGPEAGGQPQGGPPPGSFGDFTRPTERPNEPVTHGAPMGPGAGPEILPSPVNTTLDQLRSVYKQFPSQALEQIIEELTSGRT